MIEYRIPTPDTPTGGVSFTLWVLRIPDVDIIRSALLGALYDLSKWSNWVQDGDMSEDDVTQLIKEMIVGRSNMDFLLGVPIPITVETIPSNLIIADGRTVLRTEYPDLWELYPSSSKTANDLTVPDLTDKFILASGANFADLSQGGEVEHTLTIPEIPQHDHSWSQYTFGIDIESVGVPDPTGVGQPQLPQTTGITGGGQPHNNMPPYFALRYAIIGRLV